MAETTNKLLYGRKVIDERESSEEGFVDVDFEVGISDVIDTETEAFVTVSITKEAYETLVQEPTDRLAHFSVLQQLIELGAIKEEEHLISPTTQNPIGSKKVVVEINDMQLTFFAELHFFESDIQNKIDFVAALNQHLQLVSIELHESTLNDLLGHEGGSSVDEYVEILTGNFAVTQDGIYIHEEYNNTEGYEIKQPDKEVLAKAQQALLEETVSPKYNKDEYSLGNYTRIIGYASAE